MRGEKARCQRVQRKLCAYLDGELAASLGREVADHLVLCPLCRKELEDLAGVDSLVRDMPQVTLPVQFASTVASRVQERPRSDKAFLSYPAPGKPSWIPVKGS